MIQVRLEVGFEVWLKRSLVVDFQRRWSRSVKVAMGNVRGVYQVRS